MTNQLTTLAALPSGSGCAAALPAEVKWPMAFVPMSVKPQFTGSHDAAVLLYNQCDGLHIAYARFLGNEEDETNGFSGFWEFAGSEHNPEHFAAWAYLPDCNEHLFPIFGDPRPFEERA